MPENTFEKKLSKTFFIPWVGKKYEDGLNRGKLFVKGQDGVKTMILAPHHWCAIKEEPWSHCEFKKICCSHNVKQMDTKCPYPGYAGQKLSAEDQVEIERFVNPPEGARHEIFINFACGLLNLEDEEELTTEKKRDLCDRIIFHNYLQHYIPDRKTPPYDQSIQSNKYLSSYTSYKDMYDQAMDSFVEVLNRYSPDIIITWSKPIYSVLNGHINSGELKDLGFVGAIKDFKVGGHKVYLFCNKIFTGTTGFQIERRYIVNEYGKVLEDFYQENGYSDLDDPTKNEYQTLFTGLCEARIIKIVDKGFVFKDIEVAKRNKICELIRLNTRFKNKQIIELLHLKIKKLNSVKGTCELPNEIMKLFKKKK